MILLLNAEGVFQWNKLHQVVLLSIYCQHGENNFTAAVIHSSMELWVNSIDICDKNPSMAQ